MERRGITRTACTYCREKRIKCDGGNPCASCKSVDEACTYVVQPRQSKRELRCEIDGLARQQKDAEGLLVMLKSDDHGHVAAAVQGLQHGHSVENIVKRCPDSLEGRSGAEASSSGSDSSTEFGVLDDSWDEDTPDGFISDDQSTGISIIDFGSLESSAQSSTTSASSPFETPLDPPPGGGQQIPPGVFPAVNLGQSPLTNRMFDFAFVSQHVELFFAWECPPLTIIHKGQFENDFLNGGTANCSPALVAAVLSISSRLWDHGPAQSDNTVSSYWGKVFAQESNRLLENQTDPEIAALPTIQAWGLLSLRAVCEGNEVDAKELSNRSLEALTSFMLPESQENSDCSTGDPNGRAATFCGVLTLARLIDFVTFSLPSSEDTFSLAQVNSNPGGPISPSTIKQMWTPLVRQVHRSWFLSALIFELTELVHSALSCTAGTEGQERIRITMTAYHDCLNWYRVLLAGLKGEDCCTPSVHFIHIYFQFAVLTLLRPLLSTSGCNSGGIDGNNGGGNYNATIKELCEESSRTILALTQTYAGLFSLRRTPTFAPYFLYAAGSLHLLLSSANTQKPWQLGPDTDSTWGNVVTMTPIAQVVLQLEEIGVAHPAAVGARNALCGMTERAGC